MKIVIASQRPAKIKAVVRGFTDVLQVGFVYESIASASGVSSQPKSDEETLQGALNRVKNAKRSSPDGDFYVAIEEGVEVKPYGMTNFAWVAVESKSGRTGQAKTATFIVPDKMRQIVESGREMGEAADIVFGLENSKDDMGSSGCLTNGLIYRAEYLRPAVIFALVPLFHPELYL